MNPARLVFTDTPAFIPVPEALQHRKVEVILWPLDEEVSSVTEQENTWEEFFSKYTRTLDDAMPCVREELYADRLR